jgi:LysM repeat protein
VKEGETLAQIAQTESMQLKSLRTFNQLNEGEEPVAGAILELQKMTFQKPAVFGVPQQNLTSKSNIRVVNDVPVATTTPVPPIEESDLVPAGNTTSQNEPVLSGLTAQADVISSPVATASVTQIPATYGDAATTTTIAETPITATKDIPVPEAVAAIETTPTQAVVTGSKDIPVPEIVTETTAVKQEEAIPVGSKDIPVPPKIYFEKTEIEAAAKTELGPPTTVNEIPVKETKQVETIPVVAKAPEEPKNEGPKSELDILKSRFDKAVYAKPVVAAAPVTTSTETPIVEEPNATPVVKQQVATNTPKFYTVKKGDTAFSIAKSHGITVRELRELNGLDFDAIKLGQKLKVKP